MMNREIAVQKMKAHIDMTNSHSLLWGKSMEVLQPGALDEMAEWFVDQAYQAGLFDETSTLHFLERTDGWTSQTGEFIRIQLAARDELEAQLQYLEMYAVPCVADYAKSRGQITTGGADFFLESMKKMPLYNAIKSRL